MKHPQVTAVEVAIGPGLEEAMGGDVAGIWCTCGSGRRLLLGSCGWGGRGAGMQPLIKPQQGREGARAMKTLPSLLCPSSPDVPPMDWPNLKPEDRGTGRAGERWSVDLEKRRRVSSTLPLWDSELLTRLCLTPSHPPCSAKDTMEFR